MKGSELKTQIKKATQFSQCIFHDTISIEWEEI